MKRLLCALLLFLCSGTSVAQTEAKKEEPRFQWGADERVRLVFTDNMMDADSSKDDEMNFMRFRTRAWGSYNFGHGVSVGGRLTNEFRPYFRPDRDFTVHELVVDQMYLELKGTLTPRLTLKIGRQDIILGEGFVVLEGNPLDGSRTIYFNAVRATLEISKGTLEGFLIVNPSKDRFFPVIHDPEIAHQGLVEQQERAVGLYLTRQVQKSLKGEFYHFTKREQQRAAFPGSTIHTTGSRISGQVGSLFRFAGELAVQSGTYGTKDRSGTGGYIEARKDLPFYPAASVMLNYTRLSGDDPSTLDNEGWNPVFSRWPKWSELYIYTLASESRVAYWTNLSMLSTGFNLRLNPTTDLDFAYRYMKSIKPGPVRPVIDPKGRGRGDMWLTKVNFKLNKYLSGHFLAELMKPGDFYVGNNNLTYFIRAELMIRK